MSWYLQLASFSIIYFRLFLAMLGLAAHAGFLSWWWGGYSMVVLCRLLVAVLGCTYCSSFDLWALERKLNSCGTRAYLQHSMWNLPGTRDRTYIPCIGRWPHNPWPTREVLQLTFKWFSHMMASHITYNFCWAMWKWVADAMSEWQGRRRGGEKVVK